MKSISLIISLFSLFLFLTVSISCKHQTDELSQIRTISYQNDVQNIISGKCLSCHGPSGSEKKKLTTYSDVMKLVSPGDPNASDIYTAITSKWETMPPSPNSPLTAEQRSLIYVWIKQGAPNN